MAYGVWEPIYTGTNTSTTSANYYGNVIRFVVPVRLTGLRLFVNGGVWRLYICTVNGTGYSKTVGTVLFASGDIPRLGNYATAALDLVLPVGEYLFISRREGADGARYYSTSSAFRSTAEFVTVQGTEDNYFYESWGDPIEGATLTNGNYVYGFELRYESINTPPNPPTNLSVSSVNTGTPRLSWTFSDPDAGNTQSKFSCVVERWTGSAWVVHHDSGVVVSSNTYYDIPTAARLNANTQYRFAVMVWDNQDAASPVSSYYTWTTGKAYAASGSITYTSPNLGRAGGINSGTLSWSATVPADTSLTAKYRTSADGVNWGGWTSIANGGAVPPVNYVQIEFDFTSSYSFATPELHDFTLAYPAEYYASGEWVSPVIDTGSVVEAYGGNWSVLYSLNGGNITHTYRTSPDGITWTNWLSWQPYPNIQWQRYVQLKLTMTPTADRKTSPVFTSNTITYFAAYHDAGFWTSPPVDLRALDGEALLEWTTSGNTAVYARTDEGGGWSGWVVIATSGGEFPIDLSVVQQIQFKVDLTRVGPNQTPEFDKLQFSVDPTRHKGYWTSEVIDVSQAKDRTTGKIASDVTVGSDLLVTRYRYSTDGGSTFSPWTNTLSDGSIPTPANTTHVQIMHAMLGMAIEIKSTTLFFDGEPNAELITSILTANSEYDFTQLRDKLIIVNGSDVPHKYDSEGFGVLGGSPPVFKMVETHLNKVWGVERDNPSRVRWSETLNPESWPALNFIDFNPEDGSEITALHRAGSYMLVGKSNSVALITGDRDSNFSVMWLDSHERGPAGPRAVATLDKFITYVGSDGIRVSDLTKSVVNSQKLLLTWEKEINHRRLNQAAMVYWDHYLLIALPSAGSLHNDTVWVLDVLRNAWSRIVGWSVSCWLPFKQYGNEILLAGDSQTGQVYQVLTGDRDDDQLVEIDWLSGNLDLEYPERYKLFGNHTITVEGKAEPRTLKVYYTVIGGTTPDGEFFDGETVHEVAPITVPAGEGQTHIYRILPPVWGAVLGRAIAIRLITGVDVHSMTMDMTVKGIVPGGLA